MSLMVKRKKAGVFGRIKTTDKLGLALDFLEADNLNDRALIDSRSRGCARELRGDFIFPFNAIYALQSIDLLFLTCFGILKIFFVR